MRARPTIALVVLATVFAALGLGLVGLFDLRFRSGDVYPPYSSLRADPLGARAFHDSLVELLGPGVTRNFRVLGDPKFGRECTVLYLGLDPVDGGRMPAEELRVLEGLARSGARLVVSWTGLGEDWTRFRTGQVGTATNAPAARPGRARPGNRDGSDDAAQEDRGLSSTPGTIVSMRRHWGFELKSVDERGGTNSMPALLADEFNAMEGLPGDLPWRSHWAFSGVGPEWRTVYRLGEDPVVLERKVGAGTVVLCADSYSLSNEALRRDRRAGWLAWVIGGSGSVMFDEHHLGLEESAGVMTLARRYRLHGLGFGMSLLAGLWVWRSLMPFVPRAATSSASGVGEVVVGQDAASALRSLLERHVSQADVLDSCLQAWRASFPVEARLLGERNDLMSTVAVRERERPAHERDLVGAYAELCDLMEARAGSRMRLTDRKGFHD